MIERYGFFRIFAAESAAVLVARAIKHHNISNINHSIVNI